MIVWKRTGLILVASVVTGLMIAGSAAAGIAEADNHLCYKFKDVNAVTGADVAATFAGMNCNVKVKAAYWCDPLPRNNDDDPRGGPLGQTVCYKLKCDDTGGTITNFLLDTFIGTHAASNVDFDKPKFVCMPIGSD